MMRPEILQYIWSELQASNTVYVIAGAGDMPFVDDPPEDDIVEEGVVSAFWQLDEAEEFMRTVVEMRDVRPSGLKVIKLSLEALWSLIDELTTAYGGRIRIDLVDIAGADPIYSTVAEYH